jgi:GTP pyrophosphokinase
MDSAALMNKAKEYLPPDKVDLIQRAYDFACKAHSGQVRQSGEPYMEHPAATALLLLDLRLDASSVAAALLHDVSEDRQVPLKEIEEKFGPEVTRLVDGVTKLSKIPSEALDLKSLPNRSPEEKEIHAENLRRMLIAMAEDVRVVLIKLADRLHNMKTIDALPEERRRRIAHETMDIYAPLAHRLGMWDIKWQLEDLSFRQIDTLKYRQISRLLSGRRSEREAFIAEVSQQLKNELRKASIEAEVMGRPKHIYSVYQKIEKYAAMGKQFDDIHDLLALRVLVNTKADCYAVLGIVHSLWHPLAGEFNDFIASPKDNGYQSLHTTVLYKGTIPLEVQIRTHEMHQVNEYGVAAHWRYKEGKEGEKEDTVFANKMTWLRQLMEWHREVSGSQEFLESVKTDILKEQVFVYTPKGEIKDLPRGSTPLDFAYAIHTDLGNRCIGAKVNGRLVPLNYELASGDTVEIIASKSEKGPSRDWLNPDLGFVKTSHARTKIRQWFGKQERNENIEKGRQLLEKEFRRLGLPFGEPEKLAESFKYDSVEDFWAALGYGGITPQQVIQRMFGEGEQQRPLPEAPPIRVSAPSQVEVLGVGDLLTHVAQCCNPLPGDDVIGYVTRSRGVTIHRKDCPNILHEDEKERLIEVKWGPGEQLYPVAITVEAYDRVGLLNDISSVVSGEKINIAAVKADERKGHTTTIFLTLQIRDIQQLSRILSKIEAIRGVTSVTRRRNGSGT